MDWILGKCRTKLPNSFLPYIQQHMLYVHIGIASMRQFQCASATYVLFNKEYFTISFFNKFSTTFIYSKK